MPDLKNIHGEMSIIGAALLSEQAADYACANASLDDFTLPDNAAIMAAIGRLRGRGDPVDMVTLEAEWPWNPDYLLECAQYVPSAANIRYYCKIVRDCALRRRMIEFAERIDYAAREGSIEELFTAAQLPGEFRRKALPPCEIKGPALSVVVGEIGERAG